MGLRKHDGKGSISLSCQMEMVYFKVASEFYIKKKKWQSSLSEELYPNFIPHPTAGIFTK